LAAREAQHSALTGMEKEVARLQAREDELRTRVRQLEQANDDLERSERYMRGCMPHHAHTQRGTCTSAQAHTHRDTGTHAQRYRHKRTEIQAHTHTHTSRRTCTHTHARVRYQGGDGVPGGRRGAAGAGARARDCVGRRCGSARRDGQCSAADQGRAERCTAPHSKSVRGRQRDR
jgi:hypothetical protein